MRVIMSEIRPKCLEMWVKAFAGHRGGASVPDAEPGAGAGAGPAAQARLREQLMKPARLFIGAGALLVAAASIAAGPAASARSAATAARAAPSSKHVAIKCEYSRLCPDVADPKQVFDEYVGHDEPSAVFYS